MKLKELNERFEAIMRMTITLNQDDYAKFICNIEMIKLKYQTAKQQNRHPRLSEDKYDQFKKLFLLELRR